MEALLNDLRFTLRTLAKAPAFTLAAVEDRPNAERVVVLSHGLWMRRFGGDPNIVGRTISLGNEPYVVIGVVGPGFDVEDLVGNPEVWIPFQIDPNTTDQGHYFRVA